MAKKKKPDHANGATLKKLAPEQKKEEVLLQKTGLPINRRFPDGQRSLYANHFVVQHEEATATLMFFEVRSPLIVTEGEEAKKELAAIKHIDAECVARIVMPITQVPAVMEALKTNFQKFVARAAGQATITDTLNVVAPAKETK